MAALEKYAAQTIEYAVGYGLGVALGRALEPLATQLGQEAYAKDPGKAVDAALVAEGVAHGKVDAGKAQAWASQQGFGGEQFAAMVAAFEAGPAIGEAFEAWRRGLLSDAEFRTALKRTGIGDEWASAIEGLKERLLDPSQLATAIHRGIMAGQGLIVTEPPGTPGRVPQVPPSSIDAVKEAAGQGYDAERLRVLVGITGLPLSLGEMLQLLNRGDVTEDDVKRSVAQSNVRNEYMDVALALRRMLLTPHEYAEAELRGVKSHGDAQAGAALHGLNADDYATLFAILGRPLNVHAITTALARGGQYGGTYDDVPEPYRDAIRRSAIRPEYARLDYANRYSYPSAFVVRALLTAGVLTAAEAEQIFLEIGWRPDLAKKVAEHGASGSTSKADPHLVKAETQLWTAIHKSYIAEEATEADVESALAAVGVAAETRPKVLALWQHERELIRKTLTRTDVRKLYRDAKFTKDQAVARIVAMGYTAADAELYLAE